jgi:hypothetical protein
MLQITDTDSNIIKYFLQKEEGWGCELIKKRESLRILTYNFPNSSLSISITSTIEGGDVNLKLNSQEHLRLLYDDDIFREIYTYNRDVYHLFHKKYQQVKTSWVTNSDYGSISDIFKELWDSTIRYIRQ